MNAVDITKELTANTAKIMKGFETLRNIKEVEVATTPKTKVWQSDKVSLHRYNRSTPATCKVPVLIVYALVNRHDMLDLQPDRSFIKNLLEQGMDLYIIDWGYADKSDKYLNLDDYINGYIDDAVDFVRQKSGQDKINLMSICQGGTFSTIYSALHPEKVKNLITMVTPIDFGTEDGLLFKWSRDMDIDTIVDAYGIVPGEFLNTGFSMLKPMMKLSKYQGLMNMIDDEEKTLNFLRMEKWIEDSPAQAGECYRQFLKDLYQGNKLIKGTLEIGGQKVNMKNITMPLLNIYATEDHLVPPSASIPMEKYVGTKDKTTYAFQGGHIGVFVGGRSQKELAPAVVKWLKERS